MSVIYNELQHCNQNGQILLHVKSSFCSLNNSIILCNVSHLRLYYPY